MEIHDYQKVYEKLKNGEEVVPVSREEAFMMALIGRIGSSGGESERSLKTLLDYTKSTASLFSGLTDLESIDPNILLKTDTSNVTNMRSMFQNCPSLTTVPELDTGNVNNMAYMFSSCKSLTTIPELDTSNVTNMSGMFDGSSALKTVPELDTSNVTDMSFMFNGCGALETIPELDTRNVTSTFYMFVNCTSLKTVSGLDLRNVEDAGNMFNVCDELETCLIKNIKTELDLSECPSLSLDSLIYIIKELRRAGGKTLTLGSVNRAKLNGVYVKTIDITDDMRAEDDLIDEKLPFEICDENTDGGTNIIDYMTRKSWYC